MQAWKGRAPVSRHGGVDIKFGRLPADRLKPGTPNGSKLHVIPDDEDRPVDAAFGAANAA